MSSSAANNDLGEHSSPPPKRGIKGTKKAKRARYIIKIPLQKNNSNDAPLEEPRPLEAQNADPVPSQPIVGEPNHPLLRNVEPHQCQPQIEQPTIGNEFVEQSHLHSNAFVVPTTSSSHLPPSVASQIAGGRRISLSSPSQANGSPTSLPSQGNQNVVHVEGTTEGGDTSTYNDDDPPHGAVLEMIQPCNDGFFPSRVASKAITKTIKQHYVQPWPTWGAMSDEEKDVFFQRFKRKVTWRPEHEDKIRKNFHSKASHRLSEMFLEARKNGKKPSWMFDRVWTSLLVKWNEPLFRSKSAQAQKNRASEKGGSLHTGGSITIHEHALRMAQELGRAVHVDEVFQQTHVRKTTGDFVDQKSKKTYEEFQSIYSQARSEAASCGGGSQSSPIDSVQEERIRKESWFTAAGGKNSKGKVYGVGKVSQGYRLGDRLPEPGHGIPDAAKILQLEEEVRQSREEARKSREEARQTREANERLNKRFQSLVNVVLPLLSPDAQTLLLHQDDEQPSQETQDYADY